MYTRCLGALLLAAAIILPALADEKDAKDAKDDKPDTPKSTSEAPSGKAPSNERWTTVWDVVGTLGKVNGTSITLKVEYQDTGANPASTQQVLHQLQQYQQQVLRSMRSGAAGHHNYHSLARVHPSHNYHPTGTNNQKAATKTRDVDLILSDEIKVRVGSPPVEFDDKGSIKKYTPDELKTLKGSDTKSWGYAADTSALKPGEVVRVILCRKKTTPPPDKAKDKDAPADDNQSVVKIVWVLKESTADAKGADKPKEKKK